MRFAWVGGLLLAVVAAACSSRSGTPDGDGGTLSRDAGSGGHDSGHVPCTADPDCDDGFACTLDVCGVGGLCAHEAVHELCEEGERCLLATGCTNACGSNVDCNDGVFCNGSETCIRGECYPGTPADCDDGNGCTVDSCDSDVDGCRYEPAAGCDGGTVSSTDAGPPPAFDPAVHYSGAFVVAPTQSLGCPPASYAVGSLSFDVVGDTLEVEADWMTLSQVPAPSGPDFDVVHASGSCASYRLQGTFTNANELTATWTATMGSDCGHCTNQSGSIVGARR